MGMKENVRGDRYKRMGTAQSLTKRLFRFIHHAGRATSMLNKIVLFVDTDMY